MLHWANKDQYYTKSAENFTHYRFNLTDDKTVEFRLIDADTAKDNRKDDDKSKRAFVLAEYHHKVHFDENGEEIIDDILPIEESADGKLLTIRFEYKISSQKQAELVEQAEQYLSQNQLIQENWQGLFTLQPTEKDKDRTLLKKQLSDYVAKNTKDYFIHKDLGYFLKNELDFYIKNEMMNLDNLQAANNFSDIERNLTLIQAFRSTAIQLIEFLAQLENFQKKLWLKKKFVSQAYYLITLDRIPEKFYPEIINNTKQLEQWQSLFNFTFDQAVSFEQNFANSPYLVVDTSLFPEIFQANLLSELDDIDENTNGLLIHSDNFQALNLLQARYKEQIKCIYIDPPYNIDGDNFIYKDNYRNSSWLTMLYHIVMLSKVYLSKNGIVFKSIDDAQQNTLNLLSSSILGKENFIACLPTIMNLKGNNDEFGFSGTHEYTLVYARSKNYLPELNGIPLNSDDIKEYLEKDEIGFYKKGATLMRTGESGSREHRPKGYYPIYVDKSFSKMFLERMDNSDIEVYPRARNGKEMSWRRSIENLRETINEFIIKKTENGISFYKKQRLEEDKKRGKKPKTLFYKPEYSSGNGTGILLDLFNSRVFKNPKPISLLIDFIIIGANKQSTIFDYFAGSGTTGHAVINLNREDHGQRKYILVEQGDYFDTVLKPRIQKVIYSEKWKEGKPEKDENGSFNGVSQMVKVIKLESYEDTLNNLQLQQQGDLFGFSKEMQDDYLLHYMLEIESRNSLLNVQDFKKPFDYQLNISTSSAGAYSAQKIDLVETFNYLVGLRVQEIDDQREKRGFLTVSGILPTGERAFIVWRDCEKITYSKISELFDCLHINPNSQEYDVVYLNGDHNIATISSVEENNNEVEYRFKLRSIEPEFLTLMFAE